MKRIAVLVLLVAIVIVVTLSFAQSLTEIKKRGKLNRDRMISENHSDRNGLDASTLSHGSPLTGPTKAPGKPTTGR